MAENETRAAAGAPTGASSELIPSGAIPSDVVRLELATEKMRAYKCGGIGFMVYDNPARRNAISLEMQEAIPAILEDFEKDDAVRVVVMRGAGDRAFVSGADISEFEDRRSTEEARRVYDAAGARAGRAFAALGKPLIAMIRGYCIGGGLATALRADIRIASDDARFGIPAARLGLGYGLAGIRMLIDRIGPAHASEILFSARHYDATEARDIGLVNRVVAGGELEATVLALAAQIAENAPLTVRAAKAAIREALKDPERRDVDLCDRLVRDCFESADYVEGRRAFMEKRRPTFTGR